MKPLHKPRSTGEPSRTIQRKNMHTRLQAEVVFLGMIVSIPLLEK